MDKYEFNIKVEQLKKLVSKKDFPTAMKIADTIDWRKVKNIRLLTLVSQIYEENEEYQDAKDILLLAYERAPIGKRILVSLVELAVKEGNIKEAESYFKEYQEVAGNDSRSYLLRYLIAAFKEEPIETLTELLEAYKEYDFDERWAYELALLYHKAGRERECVSLCDTISLWFGVGTYVEKALELKTVYEPLTQDQQELLSNKEHLEKKVEQVAEKLRIEEEARIKAETEKLKLKEENPTSQLSGVKPKKEELLKEAEAVEEAIGLEIEELLEQDQDMLAKEIAKITLAPDVDNASLESAARPAAESEGVSSDTMQFLAGGQPDITAQLPKLVPEEAVIAENQPVDEEPVATAVESQSQALAEINENQAESPSPMDEESTDETEASYYHILVRSRQSDEGLKLATGALKKMHGDTNTSINKIAKISGTRLNERGLLSSMSKLNGKDLIIEGVSDLKEDLLMEMEQVMSKSSCPIGIVMIDTAEAVRAFQKNHPVLADLFAVVVGDSEQLEVKDFVNYAKKYANSLDCVMDEMAVLALYAIAEERAADDLPMTEAEAEYIIEEAAETASKKSIKKMLVGVFSSRYNKEGYLILKEEHFKD